MASTELPETVVRETPGTLSIASDSETGNKSTNDTFAIVICNKAQFNDDNETRYSQKFMELFQTLNIPAYPFVNITAQQTNLETTALFKKHHDVKKLWLIFIGSGIEYGPVAADNRCLNLNQILSNRQKENKCTFLTIFACPHHTPSQIQHDAIQQNGPSTFLELVDGTYGYSEFLEKVVDLQNGMKSHVLDRFNSTDFIHYFFSAIPLATVENEFSDKSILDYFLDRFNNIVSGNIPLEKILNEIIKDLEKLELKNLPLPLLQCETNFSF